ncbi:hypothetical protein ANRL2_01216 [Anaerolineae bacterium]|uniref:hypothetical protein n=1 Tax=Geobacter sp. TaxID=46610 RepID=UPI001AD0140C|nr:hypothetical protein [Geobacter sp.]CAG0965436.1 hypothetical protein ANRL2_01216 [Anaerolineae bacterium]
MNHNFSWGASREASKSKGVSYVSSLASFESEIPSSDLGDPIGFRQSDFYRGKLAESGADGSKKSATFRLEPGKDNDLFFQGSVRRRYLVTRNERYLKIGPNVFSMWIHLPEESQLIARDGDATAEGKPLPNSLGIWTYHWRSGDMGVGGKSNKSLATDSNMHGYADFSFTEKAAGRWVKVTLSPSAFRISRNYYHFFAAQAVTDDLELFPSLRQLQFHVHPKIEKPELLQIDEIKLERREPTARFAREFHSAVVKKDAGDVVVPVTIRNPTDRERRYRVYISSFLGAVRETLHKALVESDDLSIMRQLQQEVKGDGGLGAVELLFENGPPVIASARDIIIPAGGSWKGKLVHHVKPEMLGVKVMAVKEGRLFSAKRDTLTTSVIVWDPYDPANGEMDFVKVNPHNSDDENRSLPPGFPKPKRPAEGWRSEDIPLNQVGGYFVSVLTLE